MFELIDFVVLLGAAFFLSRWLGRTRRFSENRAGVFAAHAVSALAIIAIAVVIKQAMAGVLPMNLTLVVFAQAIWLVWDILRARMPTAFD